MDRSFILPRRDYGASHARTVSAPNFGSQELTEVRHAAPIRLDSLPSARDESDAESQGGAYVVGTPRAAAPRLLDRERAFKQSKGRLDIRRVATLHSLKRLKDTFHSLVNMETWKVVSLALVGILLSWFGFAILFRLVSKRCSLKLHSFLASFYLAVETVETIGYGVPDPNFHNCAEGVFVLGAAALWGTVMEATIVAIVFTRISRPQSRANAIVFSEKAVISEVDGHCYFMFQVCDLRKHQLIESHVRLYCIQHAAGSDGVVFQTRAMRLQHPDDTLGGMLLLALPQVVMHRVDAWSPLWPGGKVDPGGRGTGSGGGGGGSGGGRFSFLGIPQRAADSDSCGGSGDAAAAPPAAPRSWEPNLQDISHHIRTQQLEVLCLVEGTDPTTSSTLQSRHSYTCDDLVFNASFQRCVRRAPDGKCEIDFDAFHELVPRLACQNMLVQSIP